MEGVNTHLLLLPHLFLTRTLKERKPNEDSGNVLGLPMPWADIPLWVPTASVPSGSPWCPHRELQGEGAWNGIFQPETVPEFWVLNLHRGVFHLSFLI